MSGGHPTYTAGRAANWSLIPDHMIGGLRRYIENGIKPGSFLTALLCNDLRETCERADDVNRHRIYDYVKFLYNYAPAGIWGSPEIVAQWIERKGLGWPEVYGG